MVQISSFVSLNMKSSHLNLTHIYIYIYIYIYVEESSNVNHFLVVNVRTTESAPRGGD